MAINQEKFNFVVNKIKNIKDKSDNHLNMDSIIISDSNNSFEYNFNNNEPFNDLRSVSKPIVCMVLGIALEDNLSINGEKFTLESYVWPFFSNKVNLTNSSNLKYLKKLKLKHLLNHTYGFEEGLMFSKDIASLDEYKLLDYIFNYDIKHYPGNYFVYSNVGPYLISVIIQDQLKLSLGEYVFNKIFKKIGITHYEWKKLGHYCAGASGLKLSNKDLHKVSRLLITDGIYKNAQIVPENWIKFMKKATVETPTMYDGSRVFPKFSYGCYLWKCKDGSYYCDGTAGQYLIVLKDHETLITTMGNQGDMKPITEAMRSLIS